MLPYLPLEIDFQLLGYVASLNAAAAPVSMPAYLAVSWLQVARRKVQTMGLPDIETIPETGAVFTIGRSRFADNIASHFFIRKDPVVTIECGDEHSAVVCQTGRLFIFGSNDWGQLGLGHRNHISKPSCVKILKPERVTHVACGRAHTLICTGAQKIFACGSNQEGQLGQENSVIGDSSSSPILVYDCGLAGPRIVQLAAGSHHSMALTSDGGVVAWGSNLEGQLGLPEISGLVYKPMKVPIPEPVKEISAGYYHSVFLAESGLIYVCGESESGKLGLNINFSTQVAPKQMQLPAPALHVACGGHHTFILAENGNIYCSGSNDSGQLGMGININETHTPKLLPRGALQDEKIVKIACGESHSAILTESGKLFTCGDGRHGKLGLEENENNVHEVTFAAKYQELFVSNVACGGCHTILVGRRHEIDYQSRRQSDSMEQKKSSLPPLKLPINMQNEHRMDNTEKSTDEKDDSHHPDKISEASNNNDIRTNSSPKKDSLKENTDIVNNKEISPSAEDEKITNPSLEVIPSESSQEKDQINDEDHNNENIENKENNESKDINENNENQENNKNMETAAIIVQDVEECTETEVSRIEEEKEQKTTTNPILPPKPPRLKSASIEDASEKESLKENEEDEKEKDDEEIKMSNEENSSAKIARKSLSAISQKTVEAIENSIEKVEEDENTEELEKAEIDTQDDADVVQSPAPRIAKMARLFKGKRQEEQNGTKKSSSAEKSNPKAKSKTCTIL
ncbi:PREDICTED: LOW QUALITY PROTEIN: X-linked retinitis pigmentosa GTPase regulator [Trachymyrmex septentrionalis]|uniref:LOW QUALITY PROTEIN: X-linked retinitis pigmentosa GTPase regulator n=1 Tax=Trachymyrmex septentrionalis TaxID=34720 RepID=UPI00084F3BBC|nr:PREDICTED: LOW QUALITY PROTEIN: X-linked retinitis pigmentosa GTPase regulator [Trachymyrmex septentrionalis]